MRHFCILQDNIWIAFSGGNFIVLTACSHQSSTQARFCTRFLIVTYKLPNNIVSVACYLASKSVQVLLLWLECLYYFPAGSLHSSLQAAVILWIAAAIALLLCLLVSPILDSSLWAMEYLFHGSHTHRSICFLSFLRCTQLRAVRYSGCVFTYVLVDKSNW